MLISAIPTQRAILTATFNNSYWIGAILGGCVTFAVKDVENDWAWRIPSIVISIVASLTLFRFNVSQPCYPSPVFHIFLNPRAGYSIRTAMQRYTIEQVKYSYSFVGSRGSAQVPRARRFEYTCSPFRSPRN